MDTEGTDLLRKIIRRINAKVDGVDSDFVYADDENVRAFFVGKMSGYMDVLILLRLLIDDPEALD